MLVILNDQIKCLAFLLILFVKMYIGIKIQALRLFWHSVIQAISSSR